MVMRVGLKIVDYNCSIFSIYVAGSIAQNPIFVTIDGEKASKIPWRKIRNNLKKLSSFRKFEIFEKSEFINIESNIKFSTSISWILIGLQNVSNLKNIQISTLKFQ